MFVYDYHNKLISQEKGDFGSLYVINPVFSVDFNASPLKSHELVEHLSTTKARASQHDNLFKKEDQHEDRKKTRICQSDPSIPS
jgi:hypothetical protein